MKQSSATKYVFGRRLHFWVPVVLHSKVFSSNEHQELLHCMVPQLEPWTVTLNPPDDGTLTRDIDDTLIKKA